MFYDLNINYNPADNNLPNIVATAVKIGYDGIALNYQSSGKPFIKENTESIVPVDLVSYLSKEHSTNAPIPSSYACSSHLFSEALARLAAHGKPLKQFKRLTFVLSEDSQMQSISSNNARALNNWDIIAVQPCTEKAFLQCAQSSYVDLIAFNIQEKPLRIQRSVAKQAINQGIHFEINLSQILTHPKSRKTAMTNARQIVEATLGKNIIITSGADQVTSLRAPHDLANLGFLLGLGATSCKEALTTNPRNLTLHAATRKTFKGILQIVEIPTLQPEEQWIVPESAIENQKETNIQTCNQEQTDSPPARKRKRQN